MCLLLLSYKAHSNYKMIIAANRDEFYSRPTAPASFWKEYPDLLAGKDLKGGGTWLGITKRGKFAAITNYRNPANFMKDAPSRGKLVLDFLTGRDSPKNYADALIKNSLLYNGFNLLLSNQSELYYFSNQTQKSALLSPGIYGLSNHLLDTPWPKVEKSKASFIKVLNDENISASDIFDILSDTSKPPDELLPDTGVGLAIERALSPVLIATALYGTRSSTVIFIKYTDEIRFIEKSLNTSTNEWTTSEFNFILDR
jgi:uncharacterized protein with NRDE domain